MPSYRQTRQYARLRASIAESGRAEFERLARAIDMTAPDALEMLQRAADSVMRRHGRAAGALSARWYDTCSPSQAARGAVHTDAAKRLAHEGVALEYGRFAAGELSADALAASAGNRVKAGVLKAASETLFENVAADSRERGAKVEYTRVASGDCCAFCSLLASDDRTFSSEDAAAFDAHDGCQCVAVPYSGAADVRGYDNSRYRQMYESASEAQRKKDYDDELAERIAKAKSEHYGRTDAPWSATNEQLVIMRYQNGLDR